MTNPLSSQATGRVSSPMRKLRTWLYQRFEWALATFWRRRVHVPAPPRPFSSSPSENLQRSMNLVMPLADPTPEGRALALRAVSASIDEISTGLSNVGTVHFARFDIIDGNLCMISVYDGDFTNYIRDFISVFGSVFDALMGIVKDPPPVPSEHHPEAFIDWVNAHDALQIPSGITSLFPHEHDLRNLPRDLVVLLAENPNVQLGIYRGYPGSSVAQIRNALGVGW